ncbi:DUF4190 domain-containing protein [Candidatus Woesearchaeota archaeon]|nr:DUF4190 domain-containing protein [Candidatus Woesearchaeota archaeon]MBT5397109.1 DUF4190 domain-containing protein [Candidatus Woesearchaeota archaeon]MBT5924759.1 DUF4190 domain-containing protein [Candidatus Woesearchaeota archaeon]MBT6367345.1 DUF4190 domain-containing protein [Candidatus Woesearchaeota archaeon]MBT7762509.1 DUF4190 domain-containing protein [Candidatus Woesearchaeota archaeon]
MPDAIQQHFEKRTTRYIDEQLQNIDPQPVAQEKQQDFPAPQEPQKEEMRQPQKVTIPNEEKFHSEFSFISLILGIFGLLLPLFSTLAIIFGIGGLMQTHREHMKGKWMAILGITLGFLGIIIIVVAIIFGVGFLEDYLLKFGSIETLVGAVSAYV